MPWVRLDDTAPEDPKLDALTDGAYRLWVNALCYSSRNLTDGFVPAVRIPRLTPNFKRAHQAELLNVGLWHKLEGGIEIHNYLRYQPSASDVADKRAQEREKKARQRSTADRNETTGRFMSRGDNQRDTPRDNLGDALRESLRTHPIPSQLLKSLSDLQPPATTIKTETEKQKAQEICQRIATTLTTKPPPEHIVSLVWHAANHLDLNLIDQTIGHLATLNQPPKTLAYIATTLTNNAHQQGIQLPPWQLPT